MEIWGPGQDSRPRSTARGGAWSYWLESIVHGGMVLGMASFLLLDLGFLLQAPRGGWLSVGTGLVSAGVVALMRRNPFWGLMTVTAISLAVTLGTLAVGVLLGLSSAPVSFGEVAGIAILASEVARRSPSSQVVVGLASAAFATAASGAIRADWVGYVPVFWLVTTIAVVLGFALRWTESSRLMTADAARREERLSIARELHDSVAHHVTGIVVQAQAARAVGHSNPEAVEQALAGIEASGQATLSSMRRLVGALRADTEEEPLAPAAGMEDLSSLVDSSSDKFATTLDVEADTIPPSMGPSIYRIVQESLTNVRRHGEDVSSVEITVRRQDNGVQVTVVDDGRHQERQGRGFGLSGMAERVSALGGHFWAGARPGRGWAVTAWIPNEP